MNDSTDKVAQQAIDTAAQAAKAVAEKAAEATNAGIDWEYISILAGIMLFTGVLGGLASSLNTKKEERDYLRSILLGIVATLTIPLFLKIVDSNLIADDGELNNYSFFVFTGFCVLAAFYAMNFLEGLSSRILQDLKKKVEKTDQKLTETDERLQETAEKTDLVLDAQIAPVPQDEGAKGGQARGTDYAALAGEKPSPRAALEAAFGKNLETIETLAQKTNLPAEEIQKILGDMIKEGGVRKSTHRGKEVFGRV
jgi:hypothetical protein